MLRGLKVLGIKAELPERVKVLSFPTNTRRGKARNPREKAGEGWRAARYCCVRTRLEHF
jgi:hypothetical protein